MTNEEKIADLTMEKLADVEKKLAAEKARAEKAEAHAADVVHAHNVVMDDMRGRLTTACTHVDDLTAVVEAYRADVNRAERARDEVGIQLAACKERLRLAMACAASLARLSEAVGSAKILSKGNARVVTPPGIDLDAAQADAVAALAALDAVPGDALATSTKKDGE